MSIWISKLLGPVVLVLAIAMIVQPAKVQEITNRFLVDGPLVLISGILAMIAGLAIVNTHNLWRPDWRLIITLFGWALLLGGAIRILAPGMVDKVGGSVRDKPTMTRIAGIVWALLGLFLVYKGYR